MESQPNKRCKGGGVTTALLLTLLLVRSSVIHYDVLLLYVVKVLRVVVVGFPMFGGEGPGGDG